MVLTIPDYLIIYLYNDKTHLMDWTIPSIIVFVGFIFVNFFLAKKLTNPSKSSL